MEKGWCSIIVLENYSFDTRHEKKMVHVVILYQAKINVEKEVRIIGLGITNQFLFDSLSQILYLCT